MIDSLTHIRRQLRPLRFLLPVILLLSISSVAVLSQTGDIRVLQSDATGLTFEFSPAFDAFDTVMSGTTPYLRVHFSGEAHDRIGRTGQPDCPYRKILVRFPGASGNSVSIVSSEPSEMGGVRIAPVPVLRRSDVDPAALYMPDAVAYGTAGYFPASPVLVSDISESGGAWLGYVRCYPVQYDPARNSVRRFSRMVVRVTFGEPAAPSRQLIRAVTGLAVNDDVFAPAGIRQVAKPAALRNSVLAAGRWFRFTVTDDGIYRFTGRALLDAGIPASADPRTIRIFNNGSAESPQANLPDYDKDLIENAVTVVDAGTQGVLDASDQIIFYGRGPGGWTYNPGTRKFSHFINRYTTGSVYWLCYGNGTSKQMAAQPVADPTGAVAQATVSANLYREDEKINVNLSGMNWLGQSFNAGDQVTLATPLPGLDHSQPVSYRFDLGGITTSASYFVVSEHGASLATINVPSNYTYAEYLSFLYSVVTVSQTPSGNPSFTDDLSRLKFEYHAGGSGGVGYIDWYEIGYRRLLRAVNDRFSFTTPDTSAVLEYPIGGFSGTGVRIFDVTNPADVVSVQGAPVSSDTCTVDLACQAGSVRNLWVVGPTGYSVPGNLSPVANQNLHGDTTQAAYIIVTHPDFLAAAQRLKTYREQNTKNPLRSIVVSVNDIGNEFGGGVVSPPAIRNYLRYAYEHWSSPPGYVVLLGGGDYDFRRLLGESNPNWIPPFETAESFDPLASWADESAFVTFNNSNQINLPIGRLTARSLSEANVMVSKIIEYETSPVTDSWKQRFTFVADDGPAGVNSFGTLDNDGFSHTWDAEAVAATVPPQFEEKKIYEYAYPTEFTPGGRRKPAVNAAIRDQINQGTLVLNFNGHGNPRLWTHESIFVRETDFPLLHNKGLYFFLVAATCNYSSFDNIQEESGGELLVSMADAGAIAVFSANRPVYQTSNRTLNLLLYRYMLATDSLGRVPQRRIGDFFYQAKLQGSGSVDNDAKYFLIGDPAVTMQFPKYMISVDSINHVPGRQITALKALQRTTIAATVHDSSMSSVAAYNGNADLTVFDANRSVLLTDPAKGSTTYKTSGSVLFRGVASIRNGKAAALFIVPKDISYGNDFGRIGFFSSNSSGDGAGYSTNIRISGTDSTAPPDNRGPDIRLYIDSRSFRPGDVVSGSPVVIADLSDSSGINTSNSGIGHRLEAWVDNSPQSVDLSEYYRSGTDTYQSGSVQYPLGSMSAGSHRIRLRAWDTYDNSSMQETVFDVLSSVGLQITNVLNYPNPFAHSTVFTFVHNLVAGVDADIRIYTVAGRLIQVLHRSNVTTRTVHIPWDGRDKDGDEIANGVYLYKVSAKTSDGRLSGEALGKLSILR